MHHAAAADRLDVLIDVAKDVADPPLRSLTTTLVREELERHGRWGMCAPYIDVVELEAFEELEALARWLDVVSHTGHSRGEATAFAWAEINGGTVIIDDRKAHRAGRAHGLMVHGTLWILAQGIRAGRLAPYSADRLVDELRKAGARLPGLGIAGVAGWARQQGIID